MSDNVAKDNAELFKSIEDGVSFLRKHGALDEPMGIPWHALMKRKALEEQGYTFLSYDVKTDTLNMKAPGNARITATTVKAGFNFGL